LNVVTRQCRCLLDIGWKFIPEPQSGDSEGHSIGSRMPQSTDVGE